MSQARKKAEKKLDKQVEQTFPASDPIAPGDTSREPPEGTPVERKPPHIDKALVRKLAEQTPQPDKH